MVSTYRCEIGHLSAKIIQAANQAAWRAFSGHFKISRSPVESSTSLHWLSSVSDLQDCALVQAAVAAVAASILICRRPNTYNLTTSAN